MYNTSNLIGSTVTHGNCLLLNRRALSVIILKDGRGASTNEGLNYLIYLTSAGCRLLLYLLVH